VTVWPSVSLALTRGRVIGEKVRPRTTSRHVLSRCRRKRAALKVQHAPDPVVVVPEDPHLRAAQAAGVLLISQAQESMAQRETARPTDPPLTTISANEVTTAVAARMRTRLPPSSNTQESVPTAALEALVQVVADAALVTLTAGWTRVVAQETARREAAAAHNEQQRDVGAKWNQRSRPVAVLGAPGMGYGENVLPYLRRLVEGVALHATSRELRGACRRRRWPPEVWHGSRWHGSWTFYRVV
jgi:hypothetical protein